MIIGIDPRHYDQKARQIKTQVMTVLTRWGLMPRFKRWRLTQDPETGMVVLFGVLNKRYIAEHTSLPFWNYFDPRFLKDLTKELQVQVVSCNSSGLRYAFILDRGSFGMLPTHIDYPYVYKGKVTIRVVFDNDSLPKQVSPSETAVLRDNRFMHQIASALLNVFEDINLRDDATLLLSAQNPPDILIINEEDFNTRIAEHEINRSKVKRVKEFFAETQEERL